jgi:hypothetical protein
MLPVSLHIKDSGSSQVETSFGAVHSIFVTTHTLVSKVLQDFAKNNPNHKTLSASPRAVISATENSLCFIALEQCAYTLAQPFNGPGDLPITLSIYFSIIVIS